VNLYVNGKYAEEDNSSKGISLCISAEYAG
jgi:hypothetical protein